MIDINDVINWVKKELNTNRIKVAVIDKLGFDNSYILIDYIHHIQYIHYIDTNYYKVYKEKYEDDFFDLVYIRSDEDYYTAEKNIIFWKAKTKKYIAGNDYYNTNERITSIVNKNIGIPKVIFENTNWICEK